jgi:MFS family permease
MSSVSSEKDDIPRKFSANIGNVEVSEGRIIRAAYADATLAFMDQNDKDVPLIDPAYEKKLKRRVFYIILFLTGFVNLLMYMDKATLSYASILGMWADTGLDQDKYDNVNTIFYVGFAVGQLPGNYLLQRYPLGKFLTGVLALWTTIIFLHCAAYNYAGVIVLRFFLGMTEAVTIPALVLTMGMFLDAEQRAAIQPVFYASCMGSPIPAGFIAYGALFANTPIHAWRILMIIIGGLTFFLTIAVYFYYPDNPSNARFLTREEKVWIIRRVQASTGSSIEQKVFKKYQFVEALKDPISWLFFGFFLLQQLANNLAYQQNLLFIGIGGVSNLGSTLVSVAGGGFAVACAITASIILSYNPGYSAWWAFFWTLPALTGSIAIVALNWDQKMALLACLVLASQTFGIPWIIAFGWTSASCSGYTKKVTRNGMISAGYAIANIISPQLWRAKDAPRYVPAWIVQIILSFFTAPCLLVVVWFVLRARNLKRAEIAAQDAKIGIVELSDSEGGEREVVNVAMLDLTDYENQSFIYPL